MAYRRSASLATLAIVCALGAGAPSAVAKEDGLRWRDCGDGFQCATAEVPKDYGRPRDGTLDIAVIRKPATDAEHRIGSLFVNYGGPGGDGVQTTRDFFDAGLFDSLNDRFDIVSFDPRGTGESERAIDCKANQETEGIYSKPFPTPLDIDVRAFDRKSRAYVRRCVDLNPGIFPYVSTANVARDMDVLRDLVGDARLNYYGVSYGSYLGVTYANLFPGRFRALVVDGVLDPIAWSTGRNAAEALLVPFSTRLRSDAGAQATLNEFFRLCDAGGSRCAFSGGAAARFAALARQVAREPVEVTYEDGTTETIDYTVLIAITLGFMYYSPDWPDFAEFLAFVESAGATSRIAGTLPRPQVERRPHFGIEEQYMNFLEGFPGVACSDSVNPRSYLAWSVNGALADAQFGYFGRIWTWASSICAEWPGHDADRYLGPWNHVTANPVLVVGNRWDPATRYEGALTVRNLLPRSALLTVEGWGHTSLFLSACADQTIARYLVALATPAPGAICKQDVVPFAA